jgi:hypothetical protein
MTDQIVCVKVFGVDARPISDCSLELMVGTTESGGFGEPEAFTPAEDGTIQFPVPADVPFRIFITCSRLWPVEQELIVHGGPSPECVRTEPFDPGLAVDASNMSGDNSSVVHCVAVTMSRFRDATADLQTNGAAVAQRYDERPPLVPPPVAWHAIMDFQGPAILSTTGTEVPEMAGVKRDNVQSHGPGVGEVFLIHAPEDVPGPRLFALVVPDGIPQDGPVPFVVFHMPNRNSAYAGHEYPYRGHLTTLNVYLFSGAKRLANQVICSDKKVVLVFPLLPGSVSHVPSVGSRTELRETLFEIAYWLRRSGRPVKGPEGQELGPRRSVSVGRCALAGFSAGAETLLDIVGSEPAETVAEFPELAELYLLDPCDRNSGNTARAGNLVKWLAVNSTNRLRVYTHYPAWHTALAKTLSGTRATGPGGSAEYYQSRGSLAYLPVEYWKQANSHTGKLVEISFPGTDGVTDSSVHQIIPQFFLQHALRNSEF